VVDWKHIKVVAFDCDGVLFDTLRANEAYYNHILQHFGRPPLTPRQLRYVHMHTLSQALEHLFEDTRQREAAHRFRRQSSYLPFVRHMEPEPDLGPLLAKLRPCYHTAVATNRTDTLHPILERFGLSDQFDLLVTAVDVPNPKPSPDQLLKILEHFQIGAAQAVYVGDSEVDAAAARAAGVALVAYRNPYLDTAWHIKRLAEMEALLEIG
jgi:HAD superfamily hydrolase (TIGR01509 family)